MSYAQTKDYDGKTWILIFVFCLFLFSAQTANANYLMLETFNGDTWVVGTASGAKTTGVDVEYNQDLPDSFTAKNPEVSDNAWRWTGNSVEYDTTGADYRPNPNEAYQKIVEQAKEWEGSDTAALDWIDSFLKTYPTVDRALSSGNYEFVVNRLRKAKGQRNITKSRMNKIIDIFIKN